MIKLTRVIEEVRVIGEPAPTNSVWVDEWSIRRIEQDTQDKTWIWVKDAGPPFQIAETPEEVMEGMNGTDLG